MADLLPEYEQQFATLTAEITSKICLMTNSSPSHHGMSVHELESLMEEAKDLLERMEMEVRDCIDEVQKQKYSFRVQSHKAEFSRLKGEYSRACEKTERSELLSGGASEGAVYNGAGSLPDDMRQQLLQDNDKLEVTSTRLTRSYQVALETEAIGAEILGDLHHQRSTLQSARSRLREADHDLDSSGRVLTAMWRRALQHRFIVGATVVFVLLMLLVAAYFAFR
ncbi:Vesicle transport v-SNARE N-terminal [Trinorchestia longiramus]|nr:Vesicle transport v-SNARE N-terminal [Trinorchestia longiramus]